MRSLKPNALLVMALLSGAVILDMAYQLFGVSFASSLNIERGIVLAILLFVLVTNLRNRIRARKLVPQRIEPGR